MSKRSASTALENTSATGMPKGGYSLFLSALQRDHACNNASIVLVNHGGILFPDTSGAPAEVLYVAKSIDFPGVAAFTKLYSNDISTRTHTCFLLPEVFAKISCT